MKRNKKKNRQLALLVLLLAITIGFALLSTTLYINGTAGIKSSQWDIHWENVQVNNQSTVTAEEPEIDTARTKVTYEVNLELPGDFYEFTVDAKNDGSINGKITDIKHNVYLSTDTEHENPITLPSYIVYTLYYDGTTTAPAPDDILEAGAKQTYRVRIEYDSQSTTLPETDTSYVVVDEITYTQTKDSEEPEDTSLTGLWFYEINNDGAHTATVIAINKRYDAAMTAFDNYYAENGSESYYEQTVYDETLDDYVPYDHDNITPDYIKDVVVPSKVKLNAQGIEDENGEEYTITRFYISMYDHSDISQSKISYVNSHNGADFYDSNYAVESITFPNTITVIDDDDNGAGWYNLSAITLSNNLTGMPYFYSYCGAPTDPSVDLHIPSSVTEIHDGKLCNCKYKNVYFPSSITSLSDAFCRSGWSEGTKWHTTDSSVAALITAEGQTVEND